FGALLSTTALQKSTNDFGSSYANKAQSSAVLDHILRNAGLAMGSDMGPAFDKGILIGADETGDANTFCIHQDVNNQGIANQDTAQDTTDDHWLCYTLITPAAGKSGGVYYCYKGYDTSQSCPNCRGASACTSTVGTSTFLGTATTWTPTFTSVGRRLLFSISITSSIPSSNGSTVGSVVSGSVTPAMHSIPTYTPSTCSPKTFCDPPRNCGLMNDGCGGTISCYLPNTSSCPQYQTCAGGGVANVCGCTPSITCASAGKNCGQINNGCGGMISCYPPNTSSCPQYQTCAGGGVANVCGCTPITAYPPGLDCGDVPDGCGGTYNSGIACSEGYCGGSVLNRKPNVCTCVLQDCSMMGYACGDTIDGCGGTLHCGTCPYPQKCTQYYSGPWPNPAGPMIQFCCTPSTLWCTRFNYTCGTTNDTCGGKISCGTCPQGTTCKICPFGMGTNCNICQ
ncbi:MAG: hypothetical protein HQL15_07955, partial [Candidatus Omnitrophica bacterium]|nr:hypothetical protein [Candidatus Omnitrophota bacterium]